MKSSEFSDDTFFAYPSGSKILGFTTFYSYISIKADSFGSWVNVSGVDMPQIEPFKTDTVGYISGHSTISAGDNYSAYDVPVTLADKTETSLDIMLNSQTRNVGQIIYAYKHADNGENKWNTDNGGSTKTSFSVVQGGNMEEDAMDALALPPSFAVSLEDISNGNQVIALKGEYD